MPAKKQEKKKSYSERMMDYMREHMSGTTGDAIKQHNASLKATLYEIDKKEDEDESKERKR